MDTYPDSLGTDDIPAEAVRLARFYQALLVEGFEPVEALYLVGCIAAGRVWAPPA